MRAICKNCGEPFNRDLEWKTYCVPCFIKVKKASEAAVEAANNPAIPEDMLNRIIRLCHPDRHQNSEASNVATAFLLDMRDSVRGNG